MKKNDISYEYRVFTHRLIDVESMEVGKCTSKIIKELKPKDKVNGRFFHTSDTDEWFFCWNNELQKLNLKGDADVNAALEQVKKLISEANNAVTDAKETAKDAADAASEAKKAADAASNAVESIENKADKSEIPTKVSQLENDKGYLTKHQDISHLATKNEIPSIDGLASQSWVNEQGFIKEHQDISHLAKTSDLPTKVSDLTNDKGFITLNDIPKVELPNMDEYVTETELNNKGYLTNQSLDDYATKEFVNEEIDKIKMPDSPTMDNYYTKDEIDTMIGVAIDITNTILA